MTSLSERARSDGLTLLELLVVMVILSLLAGLVGVRVMAHVGSSKSKTAFLQIEELATALETYRLELDGYPTSEQGLGAMVAQPNGVERWNGPYLRKPVVPRDPWGRDYHYRSPGVHGPFDLFSLGADNADGGEGENADIVSWK
jgi:general secretion pathway protein G